MNLNANNINYTPPIANTINSSIYRYIYYLKLYDFLKIKNENTDLTLIKILELLDNNKDNFNHRSNRKIEEIVINPDLKSKLTGTIKCGGWEDSFLYATLKCMDDSENIDFFVYLIRLLYFKYRAKFYIRGADGLQSTPETELLDKIKSNYLKDLDLKELNFSKDMFVSFTKQIKS